MEPWPPSWILLRRLFALELTALDAFALNTVHTVLNVMTINTFLAVNCHIEEERRSKYCGTACIKVSSLQFCNESSRNSPKDSAAALKRVFKEERGCRQLEARHHVKAIISPDTLEAALSRSGLSIESLLQDTLPYPQLELPDGFTVECIQGLDRLTAADQALHGGVKTWVVDLFLNGKLYISRQESG
jgi:hypothetical protein